MDVIFRNNELFTKQPLKHHLSVSPSDHQECYQQQRSVALCDTAKRGRAGVEASERNSFLERLLWILNYYCRYDGGWLWDRLWR